MQTEVTDVENIEDTSIDGWQSVTVDEAFEFTRKPRSLDIPEGEPIPFIPMDGISESSRKIDYAESRTMEEIKSGSFVFKDDLLIAKITPSFENGKQAIIDDLSNDYGYATTEVWVLHPKEDVKILKEYLFYYLRRGEIRSDLAGKMEGSTGRQRLPKGVLKNLELYSPPLNEQQKIVSILNTVQDTIEQTEGVIQAIRELKKSMMKYLFTHGPVPVDQTDQVELEETDVGDVPSNWDLIQFDEVVKEFFSGGTPTTKNKKYWNGEIDFTTTKILEGPYLEQGEKKITDEGLKNSSSNLVPPNNILIGSRVGVGKCVINSKEIAINQDVTAAIVDTQKLHNLYLVYYFQSHTVQNYIDSCKKGSTIKGINRGDIKKLPLKLPPLEIQKVIAGNLYLVDQKINQEIDKKKSLEALFNSLLESLMTTKIRVV